MSTAGNVCTGDAAALGPSECETESMAGHRASEPDLEAEAVLRAVAHSPPRRPRSAVAPGTPWGPSSRYLVERRLGRGGMGTVYAATDTVLNRIVALKILDTTDAARDAAHHARLLREARLAARMEHERIARVYDVGTHEGFAFVAMEYVPGGTLRQRMRGWDVPVPQVVDIGTQIAEGLAELHGKGVIHRDLKPENVMLTAQGGVKLVDFGLARNAIVAAEEPGGPGRSAKLEGGSLAASGTPGYMAPEQCAGQPLDARVDVFALGVILYELVTGKQPFPGATAGAIMTATLEGVPALRDGSWDRVPERLREHIGRMLERDPQARFSDGIRALAALRELTAEMALHRSQLPAATAQSKPSTQTGLPLQPAGRPGLRLSKHVARASAVAAAAIAVFAWARHGRQDPAPLPAPVGMARIDVGTIDVGENPDEIERECAEIGSGCDRQQMRREVPRSRATVPPFFLDKLEVTNEEFARMLDHMRGILVVDDDETDHYPRYVRRSKAAGQPDLLIDLYREFRGIEFLDTLKSFRARPGYEHLPASLVSWYGAELYCETQGKRLPTEDEWEAAARGRDNRRYPWGDAVPRCGEVVIKSDGKIRMSSACRPGPVGPRAVGTTDQDVTADGIHDLGGNVAEWTSSYFVDGNRAGKPITPGRDAPRVIRGGSWASSVGARTTGRAQRPPMVMGQNLGFRCTSNAVDARPVTSSQGN